MWAARTPESVRVQVVEAEVQLTTSPVVGTTVNPAMVFEVVAPLVQEVVCVLLYSTKDPALPEDPMLTELEPVDETVRIVPAVFEDSVICPGEPPSPLITKEPPALEDPAIVGPPAVVF